MSSDWIVVVFLGDSLTNGFQQGPGFFPPRYYPFTNLLESSLRQELRKLGHKKDLVVVNQGIDGDSTLGMLRRYNHNVSSEKPDIVLIWGGINDLSARISPPIVFQNLVQLAENTLEIKAIPILLSIAPVIDIHFNEKIKELNKQIQNYCVSKSLMYIDLFSILVDSNSNLAEKYSNDGVHLSDLAYKKITSLLFSVLMGVIRADSQRFT
jgi:lysophospholipase L1-like esterase